MESSEQKPQQSPQSSERERAHELLEDLAFQQKSSVLEKRSELEEKFKEEYERDCAGFAFRCERWGAFIMLHIERKGNPTEPCNSYWGDPHEREYAISLNISLISTVKLELGSTPDQQGDISFYFFYKYGGNSIGGTGLDGHSIPREGYSISVYPNILNAPYSRPLYIPDTAPNGNASANFGGNYSSDYQIQYKIREFPRAAEDDKIIFGGIGSTLYVPAGRGAKVQEQILLSTDGYLPS